MRGASIFVISSCLPHLNRDAVYRVLKDEGLDRLPPCEQARKPPSPRAGMTTIPGASESVCSWALDSGPMPASPNLPTGSVPVPIVMVSPGGQSSLEACTIHRIDPPIEDAIRHDSNDVTGSGLFDAEGCLLALHSAPLSMNARRAFDNECHRGSALLFEGGRTKAIRARFAADRTVC